MGLYKRLNDKLRRKMDPHHTSSSTPIRHISPIDKVMEELDSNDGNLHVLEFSTLGSTSKKTHDMKPEGAPTYNINDVLDRIRKKGHTVKSVHSTPLLVGEFADGDSNRALRFYTEVQYI